MCDLDILNAYTIITAEFTSNNENELKVDTSELLQIINEWV